MHSGCETWFEWCTGRVAVSFSRTKRQFKEVWDRSARELNCKTTICYPHVNTQDNMVICLMQGKWRWKASGSERKGEKATTYCRKSHARRWRGARVTYVSIRHWRSVLHVHIKGARIKPTARFGLPCLGSSTGSLWDTTEVINLDVGLIVYC